MANLKKQPIPKLRRTAQPPLAYPGSPPDSDRAKKPSLAEPATTCREINSGDRVEGLGYFGKQTGEFGTVERANEDDAVVKWDDDGRTRVHQPWLKKIYPAARLRRSEGLRAVRRDLFNLYRGQQG
jgi:hypothetical protein